jgi:hypothetical protein
MRSEAESRLHVMAKCASVMSVQINPLAAPCKFNLLSAIFPLFLLNSLSIPSFGP